MNISAKGNVVAQTYVAALQHGIKSLKNCNVKLINYG